jgi:hypothetical protein
VLLALRQGILDAVIQLVQKGSSIQCARMG